MLGKKVFYSPKWDCQHYSSSHVLKSIVIFEKEVMPHPGIVTLLWSVTVTSQRDFKVCQLQRRVLNENPLFVLLQSVASNLQRAWIFKPFEKFPCPLLVFRRDRSSVDWYLFTLSSQLGERCLSEPALLWTAKVKNHPHQLLHII